MHTRSRLLAASLTAAMLLAALPGMAAADGHVVAGGLDNPRGITVGSDGAIYVAESGRGGPTPVQVTFEGQPLDGCLGDTGGVTRIDRWGARRIVDLPSFTSAAPDGSCPESEIGFAATGPTNVALLGNGTLGVTMGLGGNEEVRDQIDPLFGTLVRVLPNGRTSLVADLAAFEEQVNPDGEVPDSNPYGAAPVPGGWAVADAGGNDVLKVGHNGSISTAAVFPRLAPVAFDLSCYAQLPPEFQAMLPPLGTPIPPQAVTTSVTVGPDGGWYVGILTGFPFGRDNADVYRIDPRSGTVTNVTSDIDLSYITGLDFGPDGTLYVVEFTQAGLLDLEICGDMTPGAVWAISGGSKSKVADVPLPTDVAVARDGTVYVTAFSILPGGGEVWRLN